MLREAFRVVYDEQANALRKVIIKVEITDKDGLSWREAKKQLRKWYVDQAAALRSQNQKDYFNNA